MAYVTPFGRVVAVFAVVFALAVIGYTLSTRSTLEDCGDLTTGDINATVATWEHDANCRLRAAVGTAKTISMGRVNSSAKGPARFVGLRFFARLGDAPVVAILSGHRPDVYAWYMAHDERMNGYQFDVKGHLINAEQDVGYRGLGKGLRKKFGMPADAPLWIFDTAPEQ
jgi:hypothetical protein